MVGGQATLLEIPRGEPPVPRDYQLADAETLRERLRQGYSSPIYCLPTGGGKTVFAAHLIREAVKKGRRVLFLAHRRELVQQASAKLDLYGIDHGVIMAGHWRRCAWLPVQVASVQTFLNWRAFQGECRFDLVIADECHRAISKSWKEVLGRCGSPCVVGLSATPFRADGRGLGELFDCIVKGPSIEELTERGYLVPIEIWAPEVDAMAGAKTVGGDYSGDELEQRMNRKALIGDLVEHWGKHGRGRPSVAFGVSVEHSKNIAKAFCEAGVRAAHLDGTTPGDIRDRLLAELAEGKIEVLSNCAVLTEGWDCPPVSCGIIARPTLSLGLWLQMAGRILRPAPGKLNAVLLDHGGCAHQHGHIYQPIDVDLASKATKKRGASTRTLDTIRCKSCLGFFYKASSETCPYCGAVLERTLQDPKVKAGELLPFAPGTPPPAKLPKRPNVSIEECRRRFEVLEAERQRKGYKPGWVYWRIAGVFGEEMAREVTRR